MNVLTKEQFENLCQQASGISELFGSGGFNGGFEPPSEFQKQLVKKHRKYIAHEGILWTFLSIFGGVVALNLIPAPFQMWDDLSPIRSFTDILAFLALSGIQYGVGLLFFCMFYDRFISSKNRYLRRCLKTGNFTVQECAIVGYANGGRKGTDSRRRTFIVLKGDNENIYVFENNFVTFVKDATKVDKAFLVRVDNIGKKKETEVFPFCY